MARLLDATAFRRYDRAAIETSRERGPAVQLVIQQYRAAVEPMHLESVEPNNRYVDVNAPEGGHNTVAVDLSVSRARALLSEPSALLTR